MKTAMEALSKRAPPEGASRSRSTNGRPRSEARVKFVRQRLAGSDRPLGRGPKASILIAVSFLVVMAQAFGGGPTHIHVSTSDYGSIQILTTRAEHETSNHHYRIAEQLLEKARSLGESTLSTPTHSQDLDVTEQLSLTYLSLGNLRQVAEGDLKGAAADYERARQLIERIGPDRHFWWKPEDLSLQLYSWIVKLNVAQGRWEEAARNLDAISAEEEKRLGNPRRSASVQREEFGGTGGLFGMRLQEPSQCNIATTVALRIGTRDPSAIRIAFECVLRNKGREADVVGHDAAMLRHTLPREFANYANYLSLASRSELDAWLSDHGWMHAVSLDEKLQNERQTTALLGSASELMLAAQRDSRMQQSAPIEISVRRVQKTLPPESVLVEFQAFRPFDGTANLRNKRNMWLSPRYVAYLLRPDGNPDLVDLGPTQQIDRAVRRFRFELKPVVSQREIGEIAMQLSNKIIGPIERYTSSAKVYLLSPDGTLDLLPFGALQDSDGKYLIESLTFNYLTSGRDLLALPDATLPRSPPVLVGFPCFNDDGRASTSAEGKCTATDVVDRAELRVHGTEREWNLGSNRFESDDIRSTLGEVTHIAQRFKGSALLTGIAATETAVKRVAGPSVLHIATHAFFIRDPKNSPEARILDDETVTTFRVGVEERPAVAAADRLRELSPLVRSGVALSGANLLHSGENDDGILTALEISAMDLTGTQLVTLSACQTGLVDMNYGGSVTGLRRAFFIAGAASEVVSLWSVNDDSTSDMMIHFYEELETGKPVAAALRSAQLALLKGTDSSRRHPYYWAAFQSSGGRPALESLHIEPSGQR